MRTYTVIFLMSLLSISLVVDFQGFGEQFVKHLSSADSDLVVSVNATRRDQKSSEGRGTGRREFFEFNQEVTPLA